VLDIVPEVADQVTPRFDVLVTRAVNCVDVAETMVAVAGVTVTTMLGALATVIAKVCPVP
jgi:hypothetical protein